MAVVTKCPQCKFVVVSSDNYCQECGAAIPQLSFDYTPPPVPRPGLDLSIGVLLLAFFGCFVWWLIDLQQSRSPFSTKEAVIQAHAAIAANKLDQAVQLLDALSIKQKGDLSAEQQEVLNEALYARACSNASKKEYRLALSDLLRITPDYALYAAARKKVHELVTPVDQEAARPVIHQEINKKEISANDNQVTTAIKKTSAGTLISTFRPNYTDEDVARYDQLLADYFSQERMTTRRTIKDGLGVEAQNREPPSFKEWLNQGKPDF
jgi:hypothetical protein